MRWLIMCGLAAAFGLALLPRLLSADDTTQPITTSITGILIDQHCGATMMKKDDPEAAAADHPRSCAMDPACAATGYCVISGKNMIKFDDNGNKLAAAWLAASDKTDHLRVVVTGVVTDDQIQVTNLTTAP
jgi:hypothetical protein